MSVERDIGILETPCAYNVEAKRAFHRTAAKYLRRLAKAMALAKGEYDLRSNQGGIAVSGEITLHTDFIYIQVHQSVVGGSGVLIRRCASRRDYTGGQNHFMELADLVHTQRMLAVVETVLGRKLRRPDVSALSAV